MSEYVTRAEFEELKGQLQYVFEKFGVDSTLITEGTGRRRAAVEENHSLPVAPASHDEDEEEHAGLPTAPVAYNDAEEESTGWQSINDDDDEHSIDYTPRETVTPVEESINEYGEEDADIDADDNDYGEEEAPAEEDESVVEETTTLPVSEGVSPEKQGAIFDADNALTSNHIASKKFAQVTKGLFSAPYNEDEVDDFLDEYYEIFKNRENSEKDYAEALLKLDSVSFNEAQKGYKKAEVDGFIGEIKEELNRRIDILS